jgi:hypothetical protein
MLQKIDPFIFMLQKIDPIHSGATSSLSYY